MVEEHIRAHKVKNWLVDTHREESKKLASCGNRCPYAFQRRVGLVLRSSLNLRENYAVVLESENFFLKPAHRG